MLPKQIADSALEHCRVIRAPPWRAEKQAKIEAGHQSQLTGEADANRAPSADDETSSGCK
jgi:hypothetical protein